MKMITNTKKKWKKCKKDSNKKNKNMNKKT